MNQNECFPFSASLLGASCPLFSHAASWGHFFVLKGGAGRTLVLFCPFLQQALEEEHHA
jgi:hypothetical protein